MIISGIYQDGMKEILCGSARKTSIPTSIKQALRLDKYDYTFRSEKIN
jgi:hypothetical protein